MTYNFFLTANKPDKKIQQGPAKSCCCQSCSCQSCCCKSCCCKSCCCKSCCCSSRRSTIGGQPGGAGRRRLSIFGLDFFAVGPQIIGTSPLQIILRGPGVMVAYSYCNINVCSVSLLNIFTLNKSFPLHNFVARRVNCSLLNM